MKTPKITWGAAFANTWTFPGPVDNPVPDPRTIGQVAEVDSGFRDYWERRDDHELELTARFVPRLATGGKTGFSDPVLGVYQALLWLAKQNQGRFYADKDVASYHTFQLIQYSHRRDRGGSHYTVTLRIRDVDGVPFTDAY